MVVKVKLANGRETWCDPTNPETIKAVEAQYGSKIVLVDGKEYKQGGSTNVIGVKEKPGEGFKYDKNIDYLSEYALLPKNIQKIIFQDKYEEATYENNKELLKELAKVGWTFDYDLSGSQSNLRPISANKTTKAKKGIIVNYGVTVHSKTKPLHDKQVYNLLLDERQDLRNIAKEVETKLPSDANPDNRKAIADNLRIEADQMVEGSKRLLPNLNVWAKRGTMLINGKGPVWQLLVKYRGKTWTKDVYEEELTEEVKKRAIQSLKDEALQDLHEITLDQCKSVSWSDRQYHLHEKNLDKAKFSWGKYKYPPVNKASIGTKVPGNTRIHDENNGIIYEIRQSLTDNTKWVIFSAGPTWKFRDEGIVLVSKDDAILVAKELAGITPEFPNLAKKGTKTSNGLTSLSIAEDKAWQKAFEYYLNEGLNDINADKLAWKDLQNEFPRLKDFSGIKDDSIAKIGTKTPKKHYTYNELSKLFPYEKGYYVADTELDNIVTGTSTKYRTIYKMRGQYPNFEREPKHKGIIYDQFKKFKKVGENEWEEIPNVAKQGTKTETLTAIYTNKALGETYRLAGVKDLENAWSQVQSVADRKGWNPIDIHVNIEGYKDGEQLAKKGGAFMPWMYGKNGIKTDTLYQIIDIDTNKSEPKYSELTRQELIDFANTLTHYDRADNDEPETADFYTAQQWIEQGGDQKVVRIFKKGGTTDENNAITTKSFENNETDAGGRKLVEMLWLYGPSKVDPDVFQVELWYDSTGPDFVMEWYGPEGIGSQAWHKSHELALKHFNNTIAYIKRNWDIAEITSEQRAKQGTKIGTTKTLLKELMQWVGGSDWKNDLQGLNGWSADGVLFEDLGKQGMQYFMNNLIENENTPIELKIHNGIDTYESSFTLDGKKYKFDSWDKPLSVEQAKQGTKASDEKWQIKNTQSQYLSRTIEGELKWNESPDLGYSFTKAKADEIIENLKKSGYSNLTIVEYNKDWWKNAKQGTKTNEKINTPQNKLKRFVNALPLNTPGVINSMLQKYAGDEQAIPDAMDMIIEHGGTTISSKADHKEINEIMATNPKLFVELMNKRFKNSINWGGTKAGKGIKLSEFKKDVQDNYEHKLGYQLINQFDGTYQILDKDGMDISGEYETLENAITTINDYIKGNPEQAKQGTKTKEINYSLYENKSMDYIQGEIAHTERSARAFRIEGNVAEAKDREKHAKKLWEIYEEKGKTKAKSGTKTPKQTEYSDFLSKNITGKYYHDYRKDRVFRVISVDGTDAGGNLRKDGRVDIGIQYYDKSKNKLGEVQIIDKNEFDYYTKAEIWKELPNFVLY